MAQQSRHKSKKRRSSSRAAKDLVRAPSTAPTFGQVLEEMRATAHAGVSAAIVSAGSYQPEQRPRKVPRLAHGHRAQALFDGVVEAVAEAIVSSSREGSEMEMALLVADMLQARVAQHICVGSA